MRHLRRIMNCNPLIYALFGLYLAILLRLTVLRDGLLPLHFFQGGVMDLLPFAYYCRMARKNLAWLLVREFAGNMVGFAPLGAFFLWRRPKCSLWTAAAGGAAVSAVIEELQYVLGVGRASTGDVVLNALGTLLGAAVMKGLLPPLMTERKDGR